MRWQIAVGGLAALLLVGGAGCGAASSGSYSPRGDYGYGDMFAQSEEMGRREHSDSYGGHAAYPEEAPSADFDDVPVSGTMVYESEAAPPAPMMARDGAAPRASRVRAASTAGPPPPPARPQLAEARPPSEPTPAAPAPASGDEVQDVATDGPLLIYTASLNLAVHEVRQKMEQVIAIADELGGYLQSQDDTSLVIRVPAAQFRAALERIEAVGDVLSRQVSAQDVTEQFRDARIRLRNALEMRDQMAALLRRADTVPDSLTIQRELERLTQEIELLRGQLRAMEDRIAFSTVTIRFQPIRVDAEVPRERFRLPFPWLDRLGLPNLMELR